MNQSKYRLRYRLTCAEGTIYLLEVMIPVERGTFERRAYAETLPA